MIDRINTMEKIKTPIRRLNTKKSSRLWHRRLAGDVTDWEAVRLATTRQGSALN